MPALHRPPEPARGLSAHILPTAATMVGVCMTVLSIGRIGRAGGAGLLIDKALAVDAVVFLASAVLSFASMRGRSGGATQERWAEALFVGALGLLAAAAVGLAFAID
jgi:hypothetical protein